MNSDVGSQQGGAIGGSVIKFYLADHMAIPVVIRYDEVGEYTIEVTVYNSINMDGSPMETPVQIAYETLEVTLLAAEPTPDTLSSWGVMVVGGLWAAMLVWVIFASLAGLAHEEGLEEPLVEPPVEPPVEDETPPISVLSHPPEQEESRYWRTGCLPFRGSSIHRSRRNSRWTRFERRSSKGLEQPAIDTQYRRAR